MLQPSVPSRRKTVPVPPALPDAFNSRTGWPMVKTFLPPTCRLAGNHAGAAAFATAIFTGAAFIATGLAVGVLTGSAFAAGLMAGFRAGVTSEATTTGFVAAGLAGAAGTREASSIFFWTGTTAG